MAYLGTFKINTGRTFIQFENMDSVDITLEEGKTYICQVQGGKILACMSTEQPDGGYVIENDEGFVATPKNGTKLWIKNVASTDIQLIISD